MKLTKYASNIFFGSAIAGTGFSFGRDVYKTGKKKTDNGVGLLLILVIFGMFYLPYRAGKEMFRGHRRGIIKTVFITIIWNLCMVGMGFSIFMIIAHEKMKDEEGLKFAGFFFLIGSLVGLIQRSKRKRLFAVEVDNEKFLKKNSILETGDDAAPYQDAKGNCLKLIAVQKHQMVFMVVGRRNKRAYINLDKSGKMVTYIGPTKLYS